jgi:hypothetical protein
MNTMINTIRMIVLSHLPMNTNEQHSLDKSYIMGAVVNTVESYNGNLLI